MEGDEEEAKEDVLLLKKLELERGLPHARKHSLVHSVSTWSIMLARMCANNSLVPTRGTRQWERVLALDNRVVSTGPGSFPSVWLPPEGCQAGRQ